LLSFANKAGFLPVNVGAAAEVPKVPNELAQRILTEAEVIRMIDNVVKTRDKVLLRLPLLHGHPSRKKPQRYNGNILTKVF